MKPLITLASALLFLGVQAAIAGPVGVYDVAGVNPGDSTPYDGTVAVEIDGDTYTVPWDIDGDEYIGTAIGAANLKGSMIFGEAVENDTALAVSYGSGESFGLALFVEQENGEWSGIWRFGGSNAIGSEIWTRQ